MFNNFILTRMCKFDCKKPVWMKRLSCIWRKDQNLLRNTATTPQVIIKIWVNVKNKNLTWLSAQLEDPNTSPKTYWSIWNQFLHNKKTPNIPLIVVSGKVVSDFSEKSILFNSHFGFQYTTIVSNSKLPSVEFKTNQKLENITFTNYYISLIIKKLKADKAYGLDNISIQIIKLCGKSIALPLRLIFQFVLNDVVFQLTRKRVTLFHSIK